MNDRNITWNGFTRHITKMLEHILVSAEYSDVTLVCKDNVKLNAHKFILSSCSPLLKAKIDEVNTREVEIDLTEIEYEEMELVLKFMYLGNASIQGIRSNRFLEAARILQLKDICQDKNASLGDTNRKQQELDLKQDVQTKQSKFRFKCSQCPFQSNRSIKFHIESKHEGIIHRCHLCNYTASAKTSLYRHVRSKHEEQHKCNICGLLKRGISELKTHIKLVHDGVKLSCDECNYKTAYKWTLKTHKSSVHEGINFNCDKCDFKSAFKNNLRTHKRSVHEGVKYQCDECDFKTMEQGYLRTHKLSVHEGIYQTCEECDYKAAKQSNLRKHRRKVHEIVK